MNYSRSFFVFGLSLIFLLLGLGTWQLQRKIEKEILIEALAESKKKKALNVDMIKIPSLFEALYAEGRFIPGKTIFIQSKTHHGQNGVYILDVFETNKGKFLLIQRGWSREEFAAPPTENLKVEGIARVPSAPGYFQPVNQSPTYFWIDLKALSKDLALPLLPFYLVAKSSNDPRIYPTDPIPLPSNNHLQYAITWYSLAFILLVMLLWSHNQYLRKEHP